MIGGHSLSVRINKFRVIRAYKPCGHQSFTKTYFMTKIFGSVYSHHRFGLIMLSDDVLEIEGKITPQGLLNFQEGVIDALRKAEKSEYVIPMSPSPNPVRFLFVTDVHGNILETPERFEEIKYRDCNGIVMSEPEALKMGIPQYALDRYPLVKKGGSNA